jgi:hypothetical protein
MAVTVETSCGRVVLPLEFIFDGRFVRDLQDRPVAVAHLAVGAVNYKCGQRGDIFIVAAVHKSSQDLADPMTEGYRGTDARRRLRLLGECAILDDCVIRLPHSDKYVVGVHGPDVIGLSRRERPAVGFTPVPASSHVPYLGRSGDQRRLKGQAERQ